MKTHCEPVEQRKDARGSVFEPLPAAGIAAQQNVHVVLTVPGGVRGNHYHLKGTEVMVVSGPALVRLRDGNEIEDIMVPADQVYRFTVPAGVSHAVQNISARENLLVAFNSLLHDRGNPDVVTDILIEPPEPGSWGQG